jgi:hypothetical protein
MEDREEIWNKELAEFSPAPRETGNLKTHGYFPCTNDTNKAKDLSYTAHWMLLSEVKSGNKNESMCIYEGHFF